MQKNDYVVGTCISYTHEGSGIVKIDGFPIFVKGMIVGEVGKIKIIKVTKSYAIARLIELTTTSPDRVTPRCSIAARCGGCQLQHMNTTQQQAFKTTRVKDAFQRLAHLDVEVNPCLMMEDPWFYRNKSQVPVGIDKGRVIAGFFKQGSHDIVEMDACIIQNEGANRILKTVVAWMNAYEISVYDEKTHKGLVRHILTKYSHTLNKHMVVIIATAKVVPHYDQLQAKLLNECPTVETIIINQNKIVGNAVIGKKSNVMFGLGEIKDSIHKTQFNISAKSFYQVNPIQVETLYKHALDKADLKKTDEVLDIYCGIGTITLLAAPKVKHIIGVEVVQDAISDAIENAATNNIKNAEFVCADATEYMNVRTKSGLAVDVVFIDPPRKGCSTEVIESLLQLQPKKIVYISCDVSTQARDIEKMKDSYTVEYVQPVDMFPQTYHVETVVVLTKKK